ncbi:DUF1015 domain-containing protein [Saccharicrinis sp. FJH54]|uniref:DUF1015 domain-containing protein n=1 Tax=Saccharicrinis sp. FJH54 TaxID=3344665 RepID=UPI0035D51EFB
MAIIRPFKGLRPPVLMGRKVASRPYDVMNTQEAREEAGDNEKSLLHIIRPEIDLPVGTDEHDEAVYQKAVENLQSFIKKGWLEQDDMPFYYIYAQTMQGRTQYGIVACAAVDDYLNGVIKKHELTRKDKEEDRMKHVRYTNANMEPVFFAYPAVKDIDKIVADWVEEHKPAHDFTADDGFGHTLWVVNDPDVIEQITILFKKRVPSTYVADGHHRTAAAALVGKEKRENDPEYTGNEEYNFFMAVHFPDNQLNIIDYNRVVKDLNGLSKEEFLTKLQDNFEVEEKGQSIYKPDCLHNFGMYLDNTWYSLTAKPGTYDDNDPIGILDVTISSDLILRDILGIDDLRTSKRVDFVGGIRGLGELEKRVNSGEMEVAFALYPVSMKQLIDIADSGNIMPPKTTWFEPKLRSGLVVHLLED